MTEISDFKQMFADMASRLNQNRSISASLERLERIEKVTADLPEESETFRLPYTSRVPQPDQQWR